MRIRLAISVEGQTEERFIKVLLTPHLEALQIDVKPVVVATSRAADGRKSKGGGINIDRVTKELKALLQGFRDGYVTSLYDFYGFQNKRSKETVEALEARIAQRLGTPRNLLPYVQLYEYEGLLLSDAQAAAVYFQAPALEAVISKAVQAAGGPEQVNDDPATAPSKRLERWTAEHAPVSFRYGKSTKVRHGPLLAARLTLPVIRTACPRFDAWVSRLEALAPPAQP